MIRLRIGLAALTAFSSLLGLSGPRRAHAYCIWENWQGYTAIPVYHTSDLAANLRHYDGQLWTEEELHHELRWILASINSYSDAQLPLLYDAGVSAVCPTPEDCQIPGTIHITPDHRPPPDGCSPLAQNNGTAANGMSTSIGLPSCPTNPRYDHFGPAWDWGRWTLRGVLSHELMGHAMGLGHSHSACDNLTCATAPCSVTTVGGDSQGEGQNYYVDDVLGLRAIYGVSNYPLRELWESANGIGWYLFTSAPADLQPLFALSSSSSRYMFLTYRQPSTRRPHAQLWTWDPPYGWHDWFDSASYTTQGHTGAAWDGSSGFSTYVLGETQTSVTKWAGLTAHWSATIRSEYSWAATTRRHGASLAHDPKSGARVQVWRATEGQIQIEVIEGITFVEEPDGPPWSVTDGSGVAVQAYDTPTVTCGDSSISLNCIVAWASPALAGEPGLGAYYHYLRWVHFRVAKEGSNWNIYFGPIMSQSYVMHGSPVVSYRGPATASQPYVVMWVSEYATGRNFRIYTALKSTGSQATWSNWVAHPSYDWRPAAALGSANNYAELVHVRR